MNDANLNAVIDVMLLGFDGNDDAVKKARVTNVLYDEPGLKSRWVIILPNQGVRGYVGETLVATWNKQTNRWEVRHPCG